MVLTYWSQAFYGDQQWFSKKDVENAVKVKRDKGQDCALLMSNLEERFGSEPGFQHDCLTYLDYSKLDDATEYAHARTDLMAAMWMTLK